MENGSAEIFLKQMKKQGRFTAVVMVCNIILLLCMVILTLAIVGVALNIRETLDSANEFAETAQIAVEKIEELIPEFTEATRDFSRVSDSLSSEGLPKLYESLDTLNQLDIKRFNESITSLYNVVEPLSKLFGR